MITKLTSIEKLAEKNSVKKLVVAAAEDLAVLKAVKKAYQKKIIQPVLFGDIQIINDIASKINLSLNNFEIYNEASPEISSIKAIEYIKHNNSCVLMKGKVKSAEILKNIIKKDSGLLTGNILSHVGLVESPYYHKIIGITDGAVNISPSKHHKIGIIKNAISLFNKLGYSKPKIAVLGAIEKVNNKIESTVHASEIKQYFTENNFNNCYIDGPLALDNAVSINAAKIKNINNTVAGDTDILIAPNIDAGNVLYKCLNFLGGSKTAGVITGTSIPIVFTSRADNYQTKYLSILLAIAI